MWPFKSKPKDLDPAGFAAMFQARLRAAGERRPVTFDAGAFSLAVGGDIRIFLQNHYDEYRAAPPAEREALMARAVRAFAAPLEIPGDFAAALPGLLPRVRERVFHDFIAIRRQVEPGGFPEIPHRVFGGQFAASLAYDGPDSVAAVGAEALRGWKMGFEDALAAAAANLERRSGGDWERPAPGVLASPWHDDHDAARVLLIDLVRGLGLPGDPVAVIASQNQVLLAGADDAAGLAAMGGLAREALKRPRAMSGAAIRLEGRNWVPFAPAGGVFRELRLHGVARDFHEQGELLKAAFEKKGEDVFVAALMLFQNPKSGELSTLTSWAQDVESLLPEAEGIAFGLMERGKPKGIRAKVGWDVARRVLGAAMKDEGLNPPRFRVSGFPTEAQFREMGA
ncbi:MAG: hypothetical protein K8T20_01605 [Planctomycetes bacterium]|nr:hypothetical protein [Planctomycetota bacterium]